MSISRVLVIAGSDSGGGAGIQADLKAVGALGGHASTVITALTAQNTTGVQAVRPVEPQFVTAQLESVLTDIEVDTVKTGMLASPEVIDVVAGAVERFGIRRLVVDPVMVAQSGDRLIGDGAARAIRERLLPLAFVITPNLAEAGRLTGSVVDDEASMERAARELHAAGAANVLVKGGHLEGSPVDILFDGRTVHRFEGPRIQGRNCHGTGCTFSAALAVYLARGLETRAAVAAAKRFITTAIAHGLDIGRGEGPTNPFAWLADRLEAETIPERLARAAARLEAHPARGIVPEIGGQLAMCPAGADSADRVAAFPGRIVKYGPSVRAVGCPAYGASTHIAKVLLAARRFDPTIRCAMAAAWSPDIVAACERLGLRVISFSRADEPAEVKAREGSSLEWGTTDAFERCGPADVVFDLGETGKEPVVRLLGPDPETVVDRALGILEIINCPAA